MTEKLREFTAVKSIPRYPVQETRLLHDEIAPPPEFIPWTVFGELRLRTKEVTPVSDMDQLPVAAV